MPPRTPPLPEGTDQIIDTNVDVGGSAGTAAAGGSTSGNAPTRIGKGVTMTTETNSGAGSTGDNSASQFNQGRSSGSGGSTGSGSKSSGVGKAADTIVSQLKDQVSTLRSTAGDKARSYAQDGKRQTSDFLQTVAQIIQEAAGSVEQRLGSQYSGFGDKAADKVNSLARTLEERDIDALINDARSFARRSPAAAIGIAAVTGFAISRVVRAGVEELTESQSRTDGGSSDMAAAGAVGTTGTAGGGTGGLGTGATGGLGATSGGFGEQGVGTAGTMGGTSGGTGTSTGVGSSAPKY